MPKVFVLQNDEGAVDGNMEKEKINFYETEWAELVEAVARLWRIQNSSEFLISGAAMNWFSQHKSKMVFRLLGQNRCVETANQFYQYMKRFMDIASFQSVHSIDVCSL